MSAATETAPPPADRRFRTRLTVAMMLVVSAVLAVAMFFAQRRIAGDAQRNFENDFRAQLDALEAVRELRQAVLAERCRALVRKPRIHAALEDGALDLLYPSARDELRELRPATAEATGGGPGLQARWYRFLDLFGRVLPGAVAADAGALDPASEAALARAGVLRAPQIGYAHRTADGGAAVLDEVIALPVASSETGEPIAALAVAFAPTELGPRPDRALRPGVWTGGRLFLPGLAAEAAAPIATALERTLADGRPVEGNFTVSVEGSPHRLFFRRLNPGAAFPPAYEVCLYPLRELAARQQRLAWQFLAAGVLLVAGGWAASNFLSIRLARPVEKLASDSVQERAQRTRAEAELVVKQEELQRSARFSADASHQLKTPVTVLRAGLDELLAQENLPAETREELGALVHQTLRLTHVIEDLLLLSRLDAGRLRLGADEVDLSGIIDGWLDDHSVLPDPLKLRIEPAFSPGLRVAGDARYTAMILHNLLDNARKYNRPAGRLRIAARAEGAQIVVAIGNTGTPIPVEAHEHVFERFHRGGRGETTPGHGLGLNLARELARAHGGELRLAHSEDDWTEFELRLPAADGSDRAA